jgi:hypothetical protein
MSRDNEIPKQVRLYLGKANWEFISKTTPNEQALFQKQNLDMSKSYIVYGNRDLLLKFKTFYLTRCIKSKPLYMQCYVDEYASALTSSTKDEYGLNIDQDLIFLYIHEYSVSKLGRSEAWLTETILNKVASRNRDGLITIILSEVKVQPLSESPELEVINLSGVVIKENVRTILSSTKFMNGEGSSNGGPIY